ncbi:MAG TPA: hypothetical protein ENH52_02655, partial [Nitrospirae bacterium]|nr:hypothetical protein [Nitrospirota bacterium]
MDWYQIDVKETFRKLTTTEHGLSNGEIERRLKEHGPNRLETE